MAGESEQPKGADKTTAPGSGNTGSQANTGSQEGVAAAIQGLAGLYTADGGAGVTPAITDAITQALVMILGSGPALGAYQGLLQAQNANGIMYHNAVANQQKATMLGMALTAKCVRYMMDPNAHPPGDDFDDVLEEEFDAP